MSAFVSSPLPPPLLPLPPPRPLRRLPSDRPSPSKAGRRGRDVDRRINQIPRALVHLLPKATDRGKSTFGCVPCSSTEVVTRRFSPATAQPTAVNGYQVVGLLQPCRPPSLHHHPPPAAAPLRPISSATPPRVRARWLPLRRRTQITVTTHQQLPALSPPRRGREAMVRLTRQTITIHHQ